MTPMLVIFFGIDPVTAVSSDLVVSLIMKPFGAGVHARQGTVNYGLVKWLCLGSVPAAFAGVFLLNALGGDDVVRHGEAVPRHRAAAGGGVDGRPPRDQPPPGHARRRRRRAARRVIVRPLPTLLHRPGRRPDRRHDVGRLGLADHRAAAPAVPDARRRASSSAPTSCRRCRSSARPRSAHLFFGDVSFAVAGSLMVGAIPGVLIGARISSRAPDRIIRPILVVVLVASGAKLLDVPNEWLLAFLGAAVLVGMVLSLRAVVRGATPVPARDRRGVDRLSAAVGRPARTTALPSSTRQSAGVTIHYELDDEHIVLITIDRPEARNSADLDHFKWLREAWERFDADADAWVAIVTGVGDAFFTGADLKTYVPAITVSGSGSSREGLTEIDGYRLDDGTRAVLRGAKIWKPIIAAVNGYCTAGGMEMLGGVDIRVACPEAQFAVMEPKRGLFAGGGTTVRLPAPDPVPAGDGVPALRRPDPRRPGLRDGAAQPGRAAGASCSTSRTTTPGASPPTRRSRCRPRSRACGRASA